MRLKRTPAPACQTSRVTYPTHGFLMTFCRAEECHGQTPTEGAGGRHELCPAQRLRTTAGQGDDRGQQDLAAAAPPGADPGRDPGTEAVNRGRDPQLLQAPGHRPYCDDGHLPAARPPRESHQGEYGPTVQCYHLVLSNAIFHGTKRII